MRNFFTLKAFSLVYSSPCCLRFRYLIPLFVCIALALLPFWFGIHFPFHVPLRLHLLCLVFPPHQLQSLLITGNTLLWGLSLNDSSSRPCASRALYSFCTHYCTIFLFTIPFSAAYFLKHFYHFGLHFGMRKNKNMI